MFTVVASLDISFFEGRPEIRLLGNIAVVAVFAGGYFFLARVKK
jgi:hypothetical protein